MDKKMICFISILIIIALLILIIIWRIEKNRKKHFRIKKDKDIDSDRVLTAPSEACKTKYQKSSNDALIQLLEKLENDRNERNKSGDNK